LAEKGKGLRRASQAPSTNDDTSTTSKLIASVSTPIKSKHSPADPRPAPRRIIPDDAAESDYSFFSRRPGISERIRFPFENEFAPCRLEPGRSAFVRIRIERDAAGQPKRARRALRFCDGGTA
jgi:hypothetical protein